MQDAGNDITALRKPYVVLCELVGDHYHNDLVYLCRPTASQMSVNYDKSESGGMGFFSLKDLNDIPIFPNFKELLKKVLK